MFFRKALLSCALLGLTFQAFAQEQQKVLMVQDVTPELSVYPCGDRHEAMVMIRCSEPFILDFSSNVDLELKVDTTMEGLERQYRIVFETKREGTSFKGRRLAIIAPGFIRSYLNLDLKDKEKLEYQVSDPYSKLRSLFYTATEEGLKYFVDGMYLAAKDQFNIAAQCPEYATVENNIDRYIEDCDSMLLWQKTVDNYVSGNQYRLAKALLEKMAVANPTCASINTQYSNVVQEYNRKAIFNMNLGEQYLFDEKYDLARECYEKVVELNCNQSQQAALKLEEISLVSYKFVNHTRALLYQYSPGMPIGLTIASQKPEKSGKYLSLSLNTGFFDLLTDKLETTVPEPDKLQFEAAASIGWNIRLYYPEDQFIPHVWLMFTPLGYSFGGYKYLETDIETGDEKTVTRKIHAIVPEAGISIRSWRIVLNYKCQYSYVLDKSPVADDLMGGTRHSFGVGFCW